MDVEVTSTVSTQTETSTQLVPEPPVPLKTCICCNEAKTFEHYKPNFNRRDHVERHCIECHEAGRWKRAPYRTREQRYEHIKLVLALSRRGNSASEIRQFLEKENGLKHDTAWRTVNLAFEMMREKYAPKNRFGRPDPTLLLYASLEVYERIVSDPESRTSDVIAARTRMDRLLGLEVLKVDATVQTTINAEFTVRNITEIAKKDDRVRDLMIELARALPEGPQLQ